MTSLAYAERGSQLAEVVTSLLLKARDALMSDPSGAERCIDGAVSLLNAPPNAPTQAVSLTGAIGGLAPWQKLKLSAAVEARLAERLSTAQMASLVKLSPGHFTRAFSRSFGHPPHDYVTRRRLERAKFLMSETDQPLAGIALGCGMADQAHFCRLFRRYEGCSPSIWRRNRARRAAGDS